MTNILKKVIWIHPFLLMFCFQITYDVLIHKRCDFPVRTLLIYTFTSFLVAIFIYYLKYKHDQKNINSKM